MFKRFIASGAIFASGFALCAVTYGGNLVPLAKGEISSPAAATATSQTQKDAQAKVVWEYAWTIDSSDLNKLGAQGWELVGISDFVTTSGGYVSSTSYFYFKRAK